MKIARFKSVARSLPVQFGDSQIATEGATLSRSAAPKTCMIFMKKEVIQRMSLNTANTCQEINRDQEPDMYDFYTEPYEVPVKVSGWRGESIRNVNFAGRLLYL